MSLAAPNAKLVNLLVAPLALIKMEQTSPQTELVSVFKKATSWTLQDFVKNAL